MIVCWEDANYTGTGAANVNELIRISVDKPAVPPGMVMLDDVAVLTQGIYDALTRLIQRQLGLPGQRRFPDEVRRLNSVALSRISIGSGNLECAILPVEGISGRAPAVVAASDLVRGLKMYQESRKWPAYLPGKIRNRIGATITPVLSRGAAVSFSVAENESVLSCELNNEMRTALIEADIYESEQPVEIVGKMFGINRGTNQFKVEADSKRVSVKYSDVDFEMIDQLRWERIFLTGYPEDDKCRAVGKMEGLRMATEDEEDGIFNSAESRRGEGSRAYQAAVENATKLRSLGAGWDSYGAQAPDHRSIDWALSFLLDATGVLLDYGIDPPTPFMVATPMGGVQFEWLENGRALELEIPRPHDFLFLSSEQGLSREGSVGRWEAIRLIRWAATGEVV